MQIKLTKVKADYQLGPIRTKNVIDDVSLEIESGTFTAIVGPTGAGKSSLLKLINGLLVPTSGKVRVGHLDITKTDNQAELNKIRKRVGMVFQFPENQLFAETVEEDIAFGPRNFGFSDEQVKESVQESLQQVGLTKEILQRSPFTLSGGQQRRVALAGVLATKPDVLVLDEPGAGLDPVSKNQILSFIFELNREEEITVLLVTHDMNDVAQYADQVMVMDRGKVITCQPTRDFFSKPDLLSKWALDLPDVVRLKQTIEIKNNITLPKVSLTKDELIDQLIEAELL